MNAVCAATTYDRADDLWLVTSYFNPVGYKGKMPNYRVFRDVISRSGLNLVTIECAFGDDDFVLPCGPDVVQVRAHHIMWQKERLLNLAIACLPSHCTKVAWLDCDILFENPSWAVETSRLLDHYPVVQPFETAIRLPRACRDYLGIGDLRRSFGAVCATSPQLARVGNFDQHGESGLAWAARRAVLTSSGLYDAGIIGGGDHTMAHAMCGDWTSPCIGRLIGTDNAQLRHFLRWGEGFYRNICGGIDYVPGAALHLWHGERLDRRYTLRHRELESFAFDPEKDLRVSEAGCWEWASDKQEMHRWAVDYFIQRNEDGADTEGAHHPVVSPTR